MDAFEGAGSGHVAGARWEAIAAALRADIVDGRLVPGQRLPNEAELAARFAVNRHTLRQAMAALAREGHVRVEQGRGTFVRELVLDYALRRRTRMTENLVTVGLVAHRAVLSCRVAPAGDYAAALGIPARQPCEWVATRAAVRGRFISVATAVFPTPRLSGIAAAIDRSGSITVALRELGVDDYVRAKSNVSARLPTVVEADLLARSAAQPVLVVRYVNVDGDGVPVEAGTTVFAADAIQLTVEPGA